MKFLQTSDWHVGKGRSTWGEKISLDRSSRMLDAIYLAAKKYLVEGILVPGDIFDRAEPSHKERQLVVDKVLQMCAEGMGFHVYITPGNHDTVNPKLAATDFLAAVSASGEIPKLHCGFGSGPTIWENGGLTIIGLPSSRCEDDEVMIQTIQESLPATGQVLVMGHSMVDSCKMNDRGEIAEGKGRTISIAKLCERFGDRLRYLAWGDIHVRQKLPGLVGDIKGAYAGSPIPLDFGETADRGCLLVDLGGDKVSSKYIRLDAGFEPLVKITSEDQFEGLPDNAILSLSAELVIPAERKAQVVKRFKVAEDHSSSPVDLEQFASYESSTGPLQVFDPSASPIAQVEENVLHDFPANDALPEARIIVKRAAERFRSRTFVG